MEILIPVFELSRGGGAERYTYEVGQQLALRGHTVTFLTPDIRTAPPEGTRVHAMAGLNLRHTALRVLNLITFGARSTRRLRRIGHAGVVYRPLGSSFGPGVVTAHSCHAAWVRSRANGARWSTQLLDRVLLHQERVTFTDPQVRLSTVSAACADDIAEIYDVPRSQIVVAPPAVDAQTFRPRTDDDRERARAHFGLASGEYVLGIVANHADQCKRVDLMIHAAARLGATLLVAGHPDVRSEASDIARDAAAKVRFLGSVHDMHRFYSALDVFALPSVIESYGMAAHEAMAVGIPTIVSQTCGIATLLEHEREAIVIAHSDLGELVEAIDGLRDDDVRAGLATRGSRWALARGWSEVVDDLMPLLEAVDAARSYR